MPDFATSASSTAGYRPETRLVHAGTLRSQFAETSEALFLTQGFVYDSAEQCEARFKGEDSGFLYSRFSNPNVTMFERRMIELEGAQAARATATGMAAVTTAVLAPLRAGDHVVAAKAMFGSCRYVVEYLLPRYGICSTLVDGLDLDQWKRAMRPNTKSCFLESPTNPTLEVLDIGAIAQIAHAAGARLIVDNVFATPIWQSPLELGADVVVYSATKHIDGQGRCLGGIILASEAFIAEHIHTFLRQTGPSMSPFNAWILLKGLETLAIRVRAQTETAAAIADALAQHPKISRLIYPGRADHPQAALAKKQMRAGSTLVGFEIKDLQTLQTIFPLRQNQLIGKRIDCFDLHRRSMGNEFLPVLLSRIGSRRSYHAKILRTFVRANVKKASAVIDIIFMIRLARTDHFQLRGGHVCRQITIFG